MEQCLRAAKHGVAGGRSGSTATTEYVYDEHDQNETEGGGSSADERTDTERLTTASRTVCNVTIPSLHTRV